MYLKMTDGPYRGRIRYFDKKRAEQLLADGRAVRATDREVDEYEAYLEGEGSTSGGETAAVAAPSTAALRTSRPTPRPLGGGWWEVGGERVQGKQKAEELADELSEEG